MQLAVRDTIKMKETVLQKIARAGDGVEYIVVRIGTVVSLCAPKTGQNDAQHLYKQKQNSKLN